MSEIMKSPMLNGGGNTNSSITRNTSFDIVVNKAFTPIPWATATDAQIVEIVNKLDNGEITVEDTGWKVGDTRDVSLSAFTSYSSGSESTQAAQTAQLTIMHKGNAGISSVSGEDIHFVVGFKDCVASSYYHGSSNTYSRSFLKTVENNIYNALPSTLKLTFKQFNAKTMSKGSGGTLTNYPVYMCSPAEKEVFGSRTYSAQVEADALTQFKWYETSSNRIKQLKDSNIAWWERSPSSGDTYAACLVGDGGSAGHNDVTSGRGVSPFGCI